MAIVKGKKTTKPSEEVVENNASLAETITVKIRKGTEYSKESIEIGRTLSIGVDDDANEKINELIGELDSVASEYIGQFLADGSFEEEEVNDTSEDDATEEEVDEEAIRGMGKRELVKFLKENEVDIDPKEYKSLSDLQDAVVELLFSEETTEESDDTDDDASDEVSEEDIRAMDKKELIAFIKENDIDVDPSEYKKLSDLQDAVVEAISEGEETSDDDGEEGVTEEDIRNMDKAEIVAFIKENDLGINPKEYKKLADLQEAVIEQMSEANEELTSEQVMEMSKEELIELINDNDLDINPKKFKKTSELAEAVVEALFSDNSEFGDFDNTEFSDD